jgi:hypothetical protein
MPEWATAVIAKAKVAGLLGAALAAGGVGGAVALSHVTPVSQQVVTSAASTPDPTTSATAASDVETHDPETSQAQSPDPESTEASDPESTDAQGGPTDCPADVKNHGAYVSSVAHSAAHGKDGAHGKAVSAAAKSGCGKDNTDPSAGAGDPESGDAGAGDATSGDAKSSRPNADKAKTGTAPSGATHDSTQPKTGHVDTKPSHKPQTKAPTKSHAHQH